MAVHYWRKYIHRHHADFLRDYAIKGLAIIVNHLFRLLSWLFDNTSDFVQ